jgi:hypothetical protein
MGYKVQFENGMSVEFESQPSEADIDEAFQATSKQAPAKSGFGDFMGKAADTATEGIKDVGKTLASTFMPASGVGPSPGQELATSLGTAGVAQGLAPIPAAMGALNDMSQGKPAGFEQKFNESMDRMTYHPKGEQAQDANDAVGKFMMRNVVPVAPMLMGPSAAMQARQARLQTVDKQKPATAKKEANLQAAADELLQGHPAETGPQLQTRQPGAQGELFPPEVVTEKIRGKDNTVQPGAASAFDPFQEQTPFNPALEQNRLARNMELGLPEPQMPPMIPQSRSGIGQMMPEDPGFAAAIKRGVPEEVRAFEEMKQQMLAGQKSAVDTSLPKVDPIQSVTQGLDSIRMREKQNEITARQKVLEQEVAQKQSLDFNAAEIARREAAEVPGLKEFNENQRFQDVTRKVAEDQRVLKAEERVNKAEELYLKVAHAMEEGKATKEHMKRIEKDLKEFEKRLEWVKSNVEYEYMTNARKGNRIKSDTPYSRQRGAINPEVFKEGFEKIKAFGDNMILKASSKGGFLTIEAVKDGKRLGSVMYDRTNKYDAPTHQNLTAPMVGVNPEARGQGIATKMYKFAAELGNDVVKSKMTTDAGRQMWEGFEKRGLAKDGVIVGDRKIPVRQPTQAELNLKRVMSEDAKTHIGGMFGHPPMGPGRRQAGYILLEGKKKKALSNLASKLDIEDKLGEIAHSQWTPEEAVKQAMGAKDVDQNLLQRVINFGTKGGLYQALKTKNPLVRYTYEQIAQSDRLSRADIRDAVHRELAPAMREMSRKEQGEIWTLIDLADLNQKSLDLEMLARNGFNEKQLRFVEVHRKEMEKGYAAINKASAAAGKPPIDHRVAYAAMRATGDYRRLVYDEKGGKVVGVLGSDLRARVNNLAKNMEAKGYYVGEERYFGGMPRERGSANQAFMSAIEVLAEKDSRVQEFVDVLNEIRTTEVYNFLNAKTHTMQKRGVDGMEGRKSWLDAEENAREGFKAQLNYLEASLKWGHLSEAAQNIKKVLDAKEVKMPNAKKWSEDYLYNALGFNPSEMGRSIEQAVANIFKETGVGYSIGREAMAGARKVTNALLLGLNPRFWATNVVQPFQAMPAMKALLISRGLDAGFDMATGYSYLAHGGATAMKKNTGLKLDAFEKAAVKYANDNHVYGSDMIEHSNKVRKDVGFYAEKASNAVAGSIESTSRQVVFYGFAHMLKENGMKVGDGLFEAAHNLTDMAMNNYSAVERPKMYSAMGPVGDLAVNLQSYKHNELSRLSFFVREAAENKSLRPIATQLATSLVFGGIMGMIAFEEADLLYKMISKHVFKKPDSLTNMVIRMSEGIHRDSGGKIPPYVASHGVFSMMGVDLSRSLGLTDVAPDSAMDVLFPGGSKLGEIAGAGYDAAKSPTEMNMKRFGRAVAPIGVQGVLDNQWFTKDAGEKGRLSVKPKNLEGQAYRNKTDSMVKNFGFVGINESVQKQKTYNVEKIATDYADLRQGPLSKMRDELFAKGTISKETIQDYLKYRGSFDTIQGDLNRYAMQQNMSAAELSLLQSTASSSVASMEKARDYMEMFKK